MDSTARPIFILGIMPRSGTNYLWDLLRCHPDCAPARAPIREDFFLQHADALVTYAATVRRSWDPAWGVYADDVMKRLHESLGNALVDFLWVDRERRLLTKSPSVANLELFFDFFPRARLLVLVRDGRSVVQSCMTTFGWDFDLAARRWAEAAEAIHRFDRLHADSRLPYRVVRYEDLVDDLEGTMRKALEVVDLDVDAFDFPTAAALPVRGSSAFFGPERHSVHWEPVTKDPSFSPNQRWHGWDAALRERFDWIAGPQLEYFGYDRGTRPAKGVAAAARHTALDCGWRARTTSRHLAFRLRVRLGTASRPLRQRLGLVRGR